MSHSLKILLWFYRNLEQQVEDVEYKREGKQVVLIFDNADIQGTIIGFPELYDDQDQFKKQNFDKPRTLVRSLIASGCFNKVQMLPPHQLEFVKVMAARLPLHDAQWQRNFEKFFIDFSAYLGIPFDLRSDLEKQLRSALFDKPELADAWFKFLQNIEPWHSRYESLKRHKTLFLDKDRSAWINEIVGMPELELLKKGLDQDERRKGYHLNKFTDAVALTYLIKMVKLFNEGTSDIVPRFFDPLASYDTDEKNTSTVQKAIKFAELEESFHCNLPHNTVLTKPSSVFRDADYFIFKVALRNPFSAQQSEQEVDLKLIDLYKQVSEKIKARKDPSDFSKITYQGKSLYVFIDNLQKFAFLKNDWLKLQAQLELAKKLEAIQKKFSGNQDMQHLFAGFDFFYKDQESQKKVREEISKTKKDLKERVFEDLKAVSKVRDIWHPLKNCIENLEERLHPDETGYLDTFRDLGLLRYGFPRSIHNDIRDLLDKLSSGDEAKVRDARTKLINSYLQVQENEGKKKKSNEMFLTTAVLLALRLNDELLNLLENSVDQLSHYSLKAGYAEMLFRQDKEKFTRKGQQMWRKGKEIIKDLIDNSFSQTRDEQEKADLDVAIAYLSYHAWRFQVGDALWREVAPTDDMRRKHKKHRSDILNAIRYAGQAYRGLSAGDDLSKKAYALNQFIFYSVEGDDDVMIDEIKNATRSLANFKADPMVWQFRYDDTLARYFHRRSIMEANPQEKMKFVSWAMERIQDALKRSDGDRDIEHYHAVLTTYEASLN